MGQGSSKPPPSSTQHVFARSPSSQLPIGLIPNSRSSSDTPVRFSQDLVDSLQASPETDSTRAKDLELHIQSRVAAELKRLEADHTRQLKELSDQITSPDAPSSQPQNSSSSTTTTATTDLGRQTVQREIEHLKQKLANRKIRPDISGDEGVENAKGQLVRCLREKDRRPLDCWEEVEGFKREVGRLERRWVGGVLD